MSDQLERILREAAARPHGRPDVDALIGRAAARRRRRHGGALAAAAAVAALVVGVGGLGGSSVTEFVFGPPPTPASSPTPQPEPDRLPGGVAGWWTAVPDFPAQVDVGAQAVRTGTRVIVMSGRGQAAAYDSAVGDWRALPSPPLAAVGAYTTVWTGEELLAWGGVVGYGHGVGRERAGAAYDPRTGRWRELPDLPWQPPADVEAVWTGEQVVVVGHDASSNAPPRSTRHTLAFDPDGEVWRELPGAPIGPEMTVAGMAWTGEEVLVVAVDNTGVHAAAYSPEEAAWRRLAQPPTVDDLHPVDVEATSTGEALTVTTLVRDGDGPRLGPALVYDPRVDRWRVIDPPAEPDGTPTPVDLTHTVWADGRLVLLGHDPGDPTDYVALALYPDTGAWRTLADPPDNLVASEWTGHGLLTVTRDGAAAVLRLDVTRQAR